MKTNLAQTLYWTPRVVSILFIGFISLFALDVFGGSESWWMQLLGFLIHLVPTFALIIGLVIAWRWEWFGAIAYFGFAVWYMIAFSDRHWSALALLGGLPVLIGLMWLFCWTKRDEIRKVRLLV